LTRVWAERGSRPPAPRDQRHEWAYIFGAICPHRDIGAALVLPCANAQAMNLHLEEISSQVTVTPSSSSIEPDGIRRAESCGSQKTSAYFICHPIPPS
jgi:hypothetical protein